jgi:hypothetical protein
MWVSFLSLLMAAAVWLSLAGFAVQNHRNDQIVSAANANAASSTAGLVDSNENQGTERVVF